MNKQCLANLFFWGAVFLCSETKAQGIDPFSKIVVTSTNALCQPDQSEKKGFVFKYHDNVKVVFADKSQITSNNLEIIFDSSTFNKITDQKKQPKVVATTISQQSKKSDNLVSQFKKIIFEGNVHIKRASQAISSDKAELYLKDRVCKLTGNVVIKQLRIKPKDIPLEMKSDRALFHLKTEKVSFLGNSTSPVSTTIELDGLGKSPKKR